MTQETVNKIIEKLGGKHSDCGSNICKDAILIGDVLAKIDASRDDFVGYSRILLCHWRAVGFTKSLQEIKDEGAVTVKCADCNSHVWDYPEALALFKFLAEIFNIK